MATKFDPILSKVLDFTTNGWPHYSDDPDIRPFSSKSLQLSVDRGCLLWGNRVIIPPTHRKEILLLLHAEHPGESRMKALGRSFVWWPGMDREIEDLVKECTICQKTRKSAPLAPLQPWTWSKHCWQRIHLDFAEFEGKDFLVLVDSHSKWIELFHMSGTTAKHTIEKLRHCFATFGLPVTVVTDGGPQFRSVEFREFLESNGVHHVLTPPYHPASNGLAERAVQTVKEAFRRQMLHDAKYNSHRTLQHRIDSFLFTYRNTPHSITAMTPSETIFKFRPKTHLSLLKPHLAQEMEIKQETSCRTSNSHRGKPRHFQLNDKVLVRSVRNEKVNWLPGTITKIISPVTYLVSVEGRTRFAHVDHLRESHLVEDEDDVTVMFPREVYQGPSSSTNLTGSPRQDSPTARRKTSPLPSPKPPKRLSPPPRPSEGDAAGNNTQEGDTAALRRSQRTRRAPQRLDI